MSKGTKGGSPGDDYTGKNKYDKDWPKKPTPKPPVKTAKKNKKTKHPPYNELELYKEVLKLLKKEGIVI